VTYLSRKNLREHARKVVIILSWWAAPRYDFFIDTLTPLTLFDVVVLSHAFHWRGRWQKNNYDCLIYGDQQGARPQPYYKRVAVVSPMTNNKGPQVRLAWD
jgi:hypothetical protein